MLQQTAPDRWGGKEHDELITVHVLHWLL